MLLALSLVSGLAPVPQDLSPPRAARKQSPPMEATSNVGGTDPLAAFGMSQDTVGMPGGLGGLGSLPGGLPGMGGMGGMGGGFPGMGGMGGMGAGGFPGMGGMGGMGLPGMGGGLGGGLPGMSGLPGMGGLPGMSGLPGMDMSGLGGGLPGMGGADFTGAPSWGAGNASPSPTMTPEQQDMTAVWQNLTLAQQTLLSIGMLGQGDARVKQCEEVGAMLLSAKHTVAHLPKESQDQVKALLDYVTEMLVRTQRTLLISEQGDAYIATAVYHDIPASRLKV